MPIRVVMCLTLEVFGIGVVTDALASYPEKPIRVVVGFVPGSTADIIARELAPNLTRSMGQQVIVDNRALAGGLLASEITSKARPDGYTLAIVSSSHTINPNIYKTLPYDTVRDFAPVTLLVVSPSMLVVSSVLPATTVKELIAFAKAQPGKLSFASAGKGTASHLAGELFNGMAGTNMVHVAYKGMPPGLISMAVGDTHVSFVSITLGLPYVKQGKLRMLAVTSLKRSSSFPELPTISEAGVPGYESTTWYGLLAPAATPSSIIQKLNDNISLAFSDPIIKSSLANQSIEIVHNSPGEFAAYINDEIKKWRKVIESSKLQID